jgi:hypothetical protein
MIQDKSPVGPENRAPLQSPEVKLLVNDILNIHLANQRCMKQLAQECGSMPYPANRKIVKMIVMPGRNKRQVFKDRVFKDRVFKDRVFKDRVFKDRVFKDRVFKDQVPQDFLPQDLVMRRCAF